LVARSIRARPTFCFFASPSSSQVQDIGLSRRQHRFKSGWGRQSAHQGIARQGLIPFFITSHSQDIPPFGRDNIGELALSEAEGNPVGDAIVFIQGAHRLIGGSFFRRARLGPFSSRQHPDSSGLGTPYKKWDYPLFRLTPLYSLNYCSIFLLSPFRTEIPYYIYEDCANRLAYDFQDD
jgi:hypothetical protein